MDNNYDFSSIFDDDKEKKRQAAKERKRQREKERVRSRAKPKPGSVGAPLKKDIKKFKLKTFKGDPRKHFRITDCCANCKYGVFPKNNARRGYCTLATNAKYKDPVARTKKYNLVLSVSQKNFYRNEIYAKMKWVRIHATNVCTKFWLDDRKLRNVKIWIENP